MSVNRIKAKKVLCLDIVTLWTGFWNITSFWNITVCILQASAIEMWAWKRVEEIKENGILINEQKKEFVH